jgi:hypothetical protein
MMDWKLQACRRAEEVDGRLAMWLCVCLRLTLFLAVHARLTWGQNSTNIDTDTAPRLPAWRLPAQDPENVGKDSRIHDLPSSSELM